MNPFSYLKNYIRAKKQINDVAYIIEKSPLIPFAVCCINKDVAQEYLNYSKTIFENLCDIYKNTCSELSNDKKDYTIYQQLANSMVDFYAVHYYNNSLWFVSGYATDEMIEEMKNNTSLKLKVAKENIKNLFFKRVVNVDKEHFMKFHKFCNKANKDIMVYIANIKNNSDI